MEFAPLERIDEISRRPLLEEMEDLAPAGLEAVQHRQPMLASIVAHNARCDPPKQSGRFHSMESPEAVCDVRESMTRRVNNPPDAKALMTSARSFGNYDLARALADLLDNSISAGAGSIEVTCSYGAGEPEIRVGTMVEGCQRKNSGSPCGRPVSIPTRRDRPTIWAGSAGA